MRGAEGNGGPSARCGAGVIARRTALRGVGCHACVFVTSLSDASSCFVRCMRARTGWRWSWAALTVTRFFSGLVCRVRA